MSTVSRKAWRIAGSGVAVLMLLFFTMQAAVGLAHKERTETAEVPVAGIASVEIHNPAGQVRVIGDPDATSIGIRARIDDGLRRTGHSVTTDGDKLVVRATCPAIGSAWCEVRYTIQVPAGLPVSVWAERSIEVSDVTGGLEASSDGSSITLQRVDGDLTLNSDQGRITADGIDSDHVSAESDQGRISLVFDESPQTLVAEADQGSIEIVLPDPDVAYATDLSADQGDVNDLVDRDLDSARSIVAHADQGDVTLTYASS
jgi:hypothetical protein